MVVKFIDTRKRTNPIKVNLKIARCTLPKAYMNLKILSLLCLNDTTWRLLYRSTLRHSAQLKANPWRPDPVQSPAHLYLDPLQ